MKLENYEVHLPSYSIGDKIYDKIGPVCESYGKTVLVIGGEKALDAVKCLCITDDKPVFTFPTIASNCSACTSVSIMYNDDGTFLKPNFFVRPAMHAFIYT